MSVRLTLPDTATIGKKYMPEATFAPTVTVRVLVVEPLAGGVAGFGANDQVTPPRAGWELRVTLLLNPLSEDTVITLEALPPWTTASAGGRAEMLNTGSSVGQ